ncbi:MAG: alpha/beta hydrolase [Ferroplasma sp.]
MLEDKFIDINGAKIHYIESGSGIPVIMCHGARFNARTYEDSGTIKAVDDAGFRPISIDFPGYCKSENMNIGLSTFIADFIDAMHLEPGVVLGASMGGEAVTGFAVKNPDKYIALILVGAVGVSAYKDSLPVIQDKPLLLIWGKNDAISQPENYELLEQYSKNYKFYNVGRQHACYLDDAVEFNARIVEFLKTIK